MTKFSDQAQECTSLPDLKWLTGIWMGSNGDQYIEEHWSQPVGDQMIGMFRMLQAGQPVFYEFMTLGLENDWLTLSIKHFNPGLIGWEEKNQVTAYDLVQHKSQELIFFKRETQNSNWMIYRRTGSRLEVFFADATGKVDGSRFEFERSVPGAE